MKRLLIILALVFVIVAQAQAIGTTLLNAVIATGPGTGVRLPSNTLGTVTSSFTCVVTWGGTTPTNTVVALEGSLDNLIYFVLSTNTVTSSPTPFFVTDKAVKYIRGNYVSKSGGDGTTAVTLVCQPGGF